MLKVPFYCCMLFVGATALTIQGSTGSAAAKSGFPPLPTKWEDAGGSPFEFVQVLGEGGNGQAALFKVVRDFEHGSKKGKHAFKVHEGDSVVIKRSELDNSEETEREVIALRGLKGPSTISPASNKKLYNTVQEHVPMYIAHTADANGEFLIESFVPGTDEFFLNPPNRNMVAGHFNKKGIQKNQKSGKKTITTLLHQMLETYRAMWTLGFTHGDSNPANHLYHRHGNSVRYLLIDFGTSGQFELKSGNQKKRKYQTDRQWPLSLADDASTLITAAQSAGILKDDNKGCKYSKESLVEAADSISMRQLKSAEDSSDGGEGVTFKEAKDFRTEALGILEKIVKCMPK